MTDWRLTGFLCEATLTDQDKRVSIIGIMPGKIMTPTFPVVLALGAFIRVNPLPPEGTPVRIAVTMNDAVILDLNAASVAAPADSANEFGLEALHINVNRFVVMANEPGLVKLTVSVGGSEPELVSALRVEAAP